MADRRETEEEMRGGGEEGEEESKRGREVEKRRGRKE